MNRFASGSTKRALSAVAVVETLADVTASAIEALLADRTEIEVDAILPALPAHIQAARPSMKLIRAAVVAAGWRGMKLRNGTAVYRAPQSQSDPLAARDGIGSNSAADQLRLIVERAERLEEERKGISDDVKDVMAEAKSRGYDTKAIRKILAIRKKNKDQYLEEEMILDTYLQALGMV